MKYRVLIYGSPELRAKAQPVEKVDALIVQLAKDMLKTMYARNGIGLAAEQIGRIESICVIDVPPDRDTGRGEGIRANPDISMPLAMINPRITAMAGKECGQEGCLSLPEIYVSVERAIEVSATFTDLNNKEQSIKAIGMLARSIQHEVDHLNGILMVDRISYVQKAPIAGKLKKLQKSAE